MQKKKNKNTNMQTKNASKKYKQKNTNNNTTNEKRTKNYYCLVCSVVLDHIVLIQRLRIFRIISNAPSLRPNHPAPRAHINQLLCPGAIHWDAATSAAVDLMGTAALVR